MRTFLDNSLELPLLNPLTPCTKGTLLILLGFLTRSALSTNSDILSTHLELNLGIKYNRILIYIMEKSMPSPRFILRMLSTVSFLLVLRIWSSFLNLSLGRASRLMDLIFLKS